ncbi:MAG: Holliday junction resolvase RuvX [Armatimonadetes bacterium]|nr:Holliday junction resolvase RuvX [Armatimonadota bacterium]
MRTLGVDLGTKRIGLALSDREGRIASPLLVLERKGGTDDLREVARIAMDYGAESVVVGIPVNLRGQHAEAAEAATQEIAVLRGLLSVPVSVWDERMTSVVARRGLTQGGLDSRRQREIVDKVAAAVMLQSYLDQRWQQNGR